MATDDPGRCRHEMLPGQCGICRVPPPTQRTFSTRPRPAVVALVRALRAQYRGRHLPKRERRPLAERVRAAEAGLSKAELREARRIVDAALVAAEQRRTTRAREDKLADIYRPFIRPENVGRGKRS